MKRVPMPPRTKRLERTQGFRPRGHGPTQAQADSEAVAEALAMERERRALTRELVFARDGRCLLHAVAFAGRCFGASYTPHHLWKSKHGGLYVPSNLVTLCAFHNDWVEDHPPEAKAWGLVVRNGDDVPAVWRRMQFWGLLDYWWDGSPATSPQPTLEAA